LQPDAEISLQADQKGGRLQKLSGMKSAGVTPNATGSGLHEKIANGKHGSLIPRGGKASRKLAQFPSPWSRQCPAKVLNSSQIADKEEGTVWTVDPPKGGRVGKQKRKKSRGNSK